MVEETKSVQEQVEQTLQNEESIPQIDWHEKYLYLAAEMGNMKRRYQKNLSDAIEYGKSDLLLDVVNALDNIIVNYRNTDNEDERIRMEKIINEFYTMLKKYQVEPLYSLSKRDMYFNENTDNALSAIPIDDKLLDNSIADIMKKGYKYKDKILRYEDVIIYKFEE